MPSSSRSSRRSCATSDLDGTADRKEPPGARLASVRSVPPRILLVDDDAGVRGSLAAMLAEAGYQVVPAADGQQAVDLVTKAGKVFDLVILDLNMPGPSGWDTLQRLSYELPMAPVIIITARSNQLFTAVGSGAGALLEKPFEMSALLQSMAGLLAESLETRRARLAGCAAGFRYAAPVPPPSFDGPGSSHP